jgi:FkbM family methyltransferase
LGLRDTFDLLLRHPLNRRRRLAAVVRYLRWQVGSLLAPGPIAVRFVDDSLLLASFGMAAATGNVYAGLYEFEDMAFVLHFLTPADLFVDVGANIGSYTVLAAAAAGASCISLEPVPETLAHLVRNLRLNGLEARVDARGVAAGAAVGTLGFTSGLGPMNRATTAGEARAIEVPVQPLDDIVGARAPLMLKIDVEGFETEVVRGARRVLGSPTLQAVLMEQNGNGARFGYDEAALHRQLLDLGFRAFRYRPLERRIVADDDGAAARRGNVLYLRDAAAAQARVAAARSHTVLGQEL